VTNAHVQSNRNSVKVNVKQESPAVAKMTVRCALRMGALKIFGNQSNQDFV